MPVSVEQVTEGYRIVMLEAQEWFRKEANDERDEETFFWPWLEKVRPEIGELSAISEEELHRILAEWLAKFKVIASVYRKAKALVKQGATGSFDVGYGLTVKIAHRFAPAFITDRQSAGYSYATEYFEMLVEKLEAWIISDSGYGAELPYSDFWTWFKTTSVYGKLVKLEAEIGEFFFGEIGPDDRKRFENLARKWDESLRWAVTEFHEKFSHV